MFLGLTIGDWVCIGILIFVLAAFGPIDFFTEDTDEEFYGLNTNKDPKRNPHYDE